MRRALFGFGILRDTAAQHLCQYTRLDTFATIVAPRVEYHRIIPWPCFAHTNQLRPKCLVDTFLSYTLYLLFKQCGGHVVSITQCRFYSSELPPDILPGVPVSSALRISFNNSLATFL